MVSCSPAFLKLPRIGISVAREIVARAENQLALSRIRREAELRVRASEERFRALVQGTAISIVLPVQAAAGLAAG